MKAIYSLLSGQFGRFLLAGGIAAVANYGSRFLFNIWFSYTIAIVLAYLVGMVVAFSLMRTFVFDARAGTLGPQVAKFVGVNALALLQTVAISVGLTRWVFGPLAVPHSEAIAHGIGVLFPIGTSYIGHKLATFR